MQTPDFFRSRIDAMINLNDPLAVLATRLPWDQIEASLAAKFERQERTGQILEGQDMFSPTQVLEGAGTSSAGRPKLSIRLVAACCTSSTALTSATRNWSYTEARTSSGSFSAARPTTNTGYRTMPPRSGAFRGIWAKKAWSCCSRPSSIRL